MKGIDSGGIVKLNERFAVLMDGVEDAGKKAVLTEFWHSAAAGYFAHFERIKAQVDQGARDPEEASGEVIRATDDILEECRRVEDLVDDPSLMSAVKGLFRMRGIPLAVESEIVKHAFMKPGGYAGDFRIIEIVYDDRVLSRGFGHCIDRRFLVDDYARAVRSRKETMKRLLAAYIGSARPGRLEILNIACGSSREIVELFRESNPAHEGGVHFTLVDRDPEALVFSRGAVAQAPGVMEFDFLNHSVYDYIKDPGKYGEVLRGKDLVYSIGLADYLPDEILGRLITFLFGLLNPGGRLVIAHKDSKNYRPLAPDWWCDWTFHLRNEDEVRALVESSGIDSYRLSIQREATTNIIFFIILERT